MRVLPTGSCDEMSKTAPSLRYGNAVSIAEYTTSVFATSLSSTGVSSVTQTRSHEATSVDITRESKTRALHAATNKVIKARLKQRRAPVLQTGDDNATSVSMPIV